MIQFEADCLEKVYELAKKEFNCSITELEIEILQQPKKGFLGIGKKTAIIKVCYKDNCTVYEQDIEKKVVRSKEINIEEVSVTISKSNEPETKEQEEKVSTEELYKNDPKIEAKEEVFGKFYEENNSVQDSKLVIKKDKQDIIDEVKKDVNALFGNICFELDEIVVDFYDDETIYIEFTGSDAALLIGKEGYRYKALSYVLFNWINDKYNLMLRLEVAEFLKNQEESIYTYLGPVIEIIKEQGSYKTKPLDGILVHIALKKLRDEFPDKYVAVKTNVKGEKYVLVNEYRSKEDYSY
jgi:spoIIIJ-associated protein